MEYTEAEAENLKRNAEVFKHLPQNVCLVVLTSRIFIMSKMLVGFYYI